MMAVAELELISVERCGDATDRLTMRANAQPPVTYGYDANSQLSQVIQGTLSATLTHDALEEEKAGKKRGQATFQRIFVVVRAGAGSIPGPRRWRSPLASLLSRRAVADSRRCVGR